MYKNTVDHNGMLYVTLDGALEDKFEDVFYGMLDGKFYFGAAVIFLAVFLTSMKAV